MEANEIKKRFEEEMRLASYEGEDKVVEVLEVYEEEKANQKPILFNTGIWNLDALCDGFKAGEVIVITGMAKRGKTTLAKTITKNNSKKIQMLWFSFEESIYEFYKDINPADFYVPKKLKAKDMKWLGERILESKLKYGTQVVFIDHLHYLFTVGSNQSNTSLLIGDLMRTIKRIAVDNGMVIFVLAHTKKVDGNRIPRAEDVRDSALIANECDKMFVVHRDRSDGELGGSSMSPYTKVVIELDRQNGRNMGVILEMEFIDGVLKPKGYGDYTPPPPTRENDEGKENEQVVGLFGEII